MEDCLDKVQLLPFLQHIEPAAEVLEQGPEQVLVEVVVIENLEKLAIEFGSQEETNIATKDFEFAIVMYLNYYQPYFAPCAITRSYLIIYKLGCKTRN